MPLITNFREAALKNCRYLITVIIIISGGGGNNIYMNSEYQDTKMMRRCKCSPYLHCFIGTLMPAIYLTLRVCRTVIERH